MGTEFSKVYCRYNIIENDLRMNALPESIAYSHLFNYLDYSMSFEGLSRKAYKIGEKIGVGHNIVDYTEYSNDLYEFTTDGTDNEYLLENPTPAVGSEIDVYHIDDDGAYIIVTDFTYNSNTNVVTVNETLDADITLYIAAYIIGEFTDTIVGELITVLAEGMLLPYQKAYQNSTPNMKQRSSSKDANTYAQSPFKRILSVDVKDQESRIKRLRQSYTKSYDTMIGWGGGLG